MLRPAPWFILSTPILMVNRLGVSRSRPRAEVASSPFVADDVDMPVDRQRAVSVRSACAQRTPIYLLNSKRFP